MSTHDQSADFTQLFSEDEGPICTQEAARAAGLDVAPTPTELALGAQSIVRTWGDRSAEPNDETASAADAGAQLARAVPLLLARLEQATRAFETLAEKHDKAKAERDEARAKVAEFTTDTTPITLHWDRLVMHPKGSDDDQTIVACTTEDGRPAALFLDDEHREALGLQLVEPDPDIDMCTAEYGGPGYTHCELPAGHDGQHESALGNMRCATWGGGR